MPGTSHAESRTPRSPATLLFVAIMGLWLVLPFISYQDLAWDTIPLLTAGELVDDRPDEVYATERGHPNDITPTFLEAWCDASGDYPNCRNIAVPYVNTPLVLPIAVGLDAIGRVPTALAFDLLSSLALVGGMGLLWSRMAQRSRRNEQVLAVSALALTPLAMVPISIGQLSTLMFLSVCLGISATTTRRRVADSVAWVAAAVIKVTPSPLVLLLVWRRRWHMLAIAAGTVGVLFVLSLFVAPFGIWFDFVANTTALDEIVRGNNELAQADNFYAGSIAWLISQVLPGSQAEGIGAVGVQVFCLGAAVAICTLGMRRTHDDVRWAVGYLALLWNTPLLWSHYLWVPFGAYAIALAFHPRPSHRRIWSLAVFAVVLGIEGALTQSGRAIVLLRPMCLVAATVATLWGIADARHAERAGGRPRMGPATESGSKERSG